MRKIVSSIIALILLTSSITAVAATTTKPTPTAPSGLSYDRTNNVAIWTPVKNYKDVKRYELVFTFYEDNMNKGTMVSRSVTGGDKKTAPLSLTKEDFLKIRSNISMFGILSEYPVKLGFKMRTVYKNGSISPYSGTYVLPGTQTATDKFGDLIPPSIPGNIQFDKKNMVASWAHSSDKSGISKYHVSYKIYKKGTSKFVDIKTRTVSGNINNDKLKLSDAEKIAVAALELTNLEYATKIEVKVRAFDNKGNASEFSQSKSF